MRLKRSLVIFGAIFGAIWGVSAAGEALPVEPVAFYSNSEGSPLIPLIDGTRATLEIEIYEMDDPEVRVAIRRAMGRGVRVRIVKEPEPLGSACRVFAQGTGGEGGDTKLAADCADQRRLVQEVRSAGGAYVPFSKAELCGGNPGESCFEHGKLLISDSSAALVSTGNFNITSLCDVAHSPKNCNRDYSVVVHDREVVEALQAVFEKDLAGKRYDLASVLPPGVSSRLTVSPLSLAPLEAFIRSARKSLQIQNQYLKEPALNDAIVAAARAGVRVEVTVASPCSFGKPSTEEARTVQQVFSGFDAAGVSSRMFNHRILINHIPGYLHAKAIVVDGVRAWVGSVNGSSEAVSRNREFGIFMEGSTDVSRLSSIMSADHQDPAEETWQDSLQCREGS